MNSTKFAGIAGFFVAFVMAATIVLQSASADVCGTGYGVDVYSLDVHGNVISAFVKNTGSCEKPIYYTLYIDGGIVAESQFTLASGSVRQFERNYNFGYGTYEVKLTVTDRCSSDYDRIDHIVLQQPSCGTCNTCTGCNQHVACADGWVDEYKCVDGWRQRKYVDGNCEIKWYNFDRAECGSGSACNGYDGCSSCSSGCTTCSGCNSNTWQDGWMDNYRCSGSGVQRWFVSGGLGAWKDWESCSHGCSNGKCVEACGVDITAMNFKDHVVAGQRTDIRVNAKNLADEKQVMSLALYVDGERKDSYSAWVDAGSMLIKDFFVYVDKTSTVRVEASTTCGGKDYASTTLNVVQPTTEDAYFPTIVTPVTAEDTSVYVYPDTLDIEMGSSKVIAIDIKSKRVQDFTIDVSGVPESWVSYDKRVGVNEKKTAYIYVTGRDLGMKNLVVTVKATSENLAFKQNVNVFVARNINVVRVDWTGDFIAGVASVVTSAWFLLAIVVIILILVIAYGAYNLNYYEF